MKKSFLMLLIAALFTAQLWAQEECGYVPDEAYIATWKNQNSIPNKRLKFLKEYSLENVRQMKEIKYINGQFKPVMRGSGTQGDGVEGDLFNGTQRTVPVVAHIVRRSNGTGGLSTADLNASIARANNFYASANMRFVLCETKYIDDNNIYSHSFSHLSESNSNSNASFNKLNMTTRNVSRKLNIYFVPNSSTSWTWRPLTDTRRQHIMMLNSQAKNESTLSHEIGHWFDLFHTHQGGDELVNGSNCSTAGDFVCDTRADPNISGRVNGSCAYTGGSSLVDANGQTYNPDPRNMMSYSTKPCRNRFSNGQVYKMQSAYLGMNTDRNYTFSMCISGITMRGYYRCNDGGHYYVRQVGNQVFWFGEHPGGNWANVFKGTLNGTTLRGSFYDVPKGRIAGKGELHLIVSLDGNSISKVTGPFGGSSWTKASLPANLPGKRPAGFSQFGNINDMDGAWSCNDGGTYYIREVGGKIAWFGEGGLNSNGKPRFANVAIGTRSGNNITLDWADVPKCNMSGKGQLRLKVNSANEIVKVSGGGFGGSKWTRYSIDGTWKNKDTNTGGITKVIISGNETKIHAYGKCHPTDCDWEKTTLSKSGSTYRATYNQGFATKKLTITLQANGEMKLVVFADYNDNRPDKTSTYYMKKQLIATLIPGSLRPATSILLNPGG